MKAEKGEKSGKILCRTLLSLAILMLSMLWGNVVMAEETVVVHYGGQLDYTKANQVVGLVNQQRSANGLGSLTQTGDLQQMAMIRAMEIALYFEHTRPNGTKGLDIMTTGGTRAENIAVGRTTASAVMDDWMNSSGHKANILNGSVTQIGVGCFTSDGTTWWVQLFRSGSGGSGTVQSGVVSKAIEVTARLSVLDIHMVKMGEPFTVNGVINMNGGETVSVAAMNKNVATSGTAVLSLYATSPGLSWKAGSDLVVNTFDAYVGAYLHAVTCGSRSLTLSYGSRSVQANVSVDHVKESGTNCTKDIKCTICGTVLQKKAGHYINLSCVEKPCAKCGEPVPPTKAHKPDMTATCQYASYCIECHTKLQDIQPHSYEAATCQAPKTCIWCGATTGGTGDHVWGSWLSSGGWRTRRCTVCHKPQTEQIGQSGTNTGTGSGTITSSGSSTGSVSGGKRVISLKITGSTSLLTGKSTTLKVTVSPSNATNKAVTWSSSNKKYATVSSKGVVKALKAGAGKTVTITAKAKDGSGKKATFKVKIKGAVSKITLKGSKSLKAGKKTTVKATVKVGKGGSKALSWSSSNKKYATVSSKGVVKAQKAGKGKTVTITAKAKDGSGKKATIKIKIK